MKKLLLIFLCLLLHFTGLSQDQKYYGFYRPDTGYNDFSVTNFNELWGKTEGAITKQILATGNFKKVRSKLEESRRIVTFQNLKLHYTLVIFAFNIETGLEKIVVTRNYIDLPESKITPIILPLLSSVYPDSDGINRDKKNNVTSWRSQSEKDRYFLDSFIPYTTIRLH